MAEFPHLEAFIERLPQGLASYPDAVAKASLLRSFVQVRPVPRSARERLPAPLVALLEAPPPVSHWIPEVHKHAMLLVLRDTIFADEADYVRYCYLRQRELFVGPMYRVLFTLASPSLLFRTVALRWRSLHRGSTLTLEEHSETTARLCLRHPPALWDPVVGLATAAGMRVVVDLAGGVGAEVETEHPSPQETVFRGRWSLR